MISRVKSIIIVIIIIIINLGQASPSRPKKLEPGNGASPKLFGCGRSANSNPLGLAAPSDPRLCVLYKDPILIGHVSGSNYHWVLCQDPILLGPVSGPKAKGPCILIHLDIVSGPNSLRFGISTQG